MRVPDSGRLRPRGRGEPDWQDLVGDAPQPVEAVVWASAPVAADDPCRTGSPEAVRAFENNARSFNG